MSTKPARATVHDCAPTRTALCLIVLAAFIGVSVVLPARALMVGGPTIQAVWVRTIGSGSGIGITASVRNETSIAWVNLSFSPTQDQPLSPPVQMRFESFDARAGTYNYTYEMDWPYNSIRIFIVAVDANGTAGPPFDALDSWTSSTAVGTTPLFDGVLLTGGLAVIAAVGSLGGAVLLRRLLRARRP